MVGGKKGAVSILLRPLLCVMPAEPGSRLMLFVAFVWSLTADADKVGYSFASSFLVFMVVQRAGDDDAARVSVPVQVRRWEVRARGDE